MPNVHVQYLDQILNMIQNITLILYQIFQCSICPIILFLKIIGAGGGSPQQKSTAGRTFVNTCLATSAATTIFGYVCQNICQNIVQYLYQKLTPDRTFVKNFRPQQSQRYPPEKYFAENLMEELLATPTKT